MREIMDAMASTRYQQLLLWLGSLDINGPLQLEGLTRASSDASFRQYYRLKHADTTLIVMDAPPSTENNEAFIDITQRLADQGLNVPQILAQNLDLGFLVLSDLGDLNYYHALHQGLDNDTVQSLYRQALFSLVRLQQADTQGLPLYNAPKMLEELGLFETWYVNQHCQTEFTPTEQAQLEQCFAVLVADNTQAAQVLVHRDYHSPNLMLPQDASLQPGIIDYQDAVLGPITYDLASLVMDARYSWDEAQQLDWAIRYWEAAKAAQLPVNTNFADFHRAYEWMSVQRNLRILGVFARLALRDHKPQYLDHIPRVAAYIRQVVSRYEALFPIRKLFDRLESRTTVLGVTL